eukprot:scaffold24528_cov120-Isochrysis_galbana.AAC.3
MRRQPHLCKRTAASVPILEGDARMAAVASVQAHAPSPMHIGDLRASAEGKPERACPLAGAAATPSLPSPSAPAAAPRAPAKPQTRSWPACAPLTS